MQTFEQPKYLMAAKQCENVIWRRGLLRKGYGLCHGAAGNVYALIALWQSSNDEQCLVRALQV